MRGLGVKISALLVLVFSLTAGILLYSGCEEEKKEVCCKCTCYVLDGGRPDMPAYVNRTNLNCSSACITRCDEFGMKTKDPTDISCESTPTDN